jgi:hypothetical protein
MNGKQWTESDTATLRRNAGRVSDARIAELTGHCEKTIRARRHALSLPSYHPKRSGWSRRDYLLAGAAGLMVEGTDAW